MKKYRYNKLDTIEEKTLNYTKRRYYYSEDIKKVFSLAEPINMSYYLSLDNDFEPEYFIDLHVDINIKINYQEI